MIQSLVPRKIYKTSGPHSGGAGEEQVFETGCTGGYGGKSTFEAVRGGTNHYSIYST